MIPLCFQNHIGFAICCDAVDASSESPEEPPDAMERPMRTAQASHRAPHAHPTPTTAQPAEREGGESARRTRRSSLRRKISCLIAQIGLLRIPGPPLNIMPTTSYMKFAIDQFNRSSSVPSVDSSHTVADSPHALCAAELC